MKALKSFDFGSSNRGSYDWDKILDGGIYELIQGQDYECTSSTMQTMSRNQAKARNKGVRISKNADETGLVVQAYDASPEQIAKWEEARKAGKEEEAETVAETEETVAAPAKPAGKGKKK